MANGFSQVLPLRQRSSGEVRVCAYWRDILSAVDKTVAAQSEAGFTTLIGLCVTPDGICGTSYGGSAALLIDGEQWGELTAKQRKNPPLGSGEVTAITFQINRVEVSRLLLISDGVWKFVGFDRIVATARAQSGVDLVRELRELQESGNAGKLPDDFSIIAV